MEKTDAYDVTLTEVHPPVVYDEEPTSARHIVLMELRDGTTVSIKDDGRNVRVSVYDDDTEDTFSFELTDRENAQFRSALLNSDIAAAGI